MRSRTVALGLGSNLGRPLVHLRLALREIKKITSVKVLKVSSIYESDAQLPTGATDDWHHKYLNAVVLCETGEDLSAHELLKNIKDIEMKLGRNASEKWAPRIIDIDILCWSDFDFKDDILQIPHPHLMTRPFALLPLLEVWPLAMVGELPEWAAEWKSDKPFHTKKSKTNFWPEMVGILNVTDDSFSDGGKFISPEAIQNQLLRLLDAGADIIDIGAESTRPRAILVDATTESRRLGAALIVLAELRGVRDFKVSLDSRNANVVSQVLASGAEIDFLNDVTGFENPRMQSILAESKLKAFVMHSLSIPPRADLTLDEDTNPCSQLIDWWIKKVESLQNLGIENDQLIFDPGIGFGKTKLQNMYILNHLEQFYSMRVDIMIGHSRKSFQGYFSDRPADQRDFETALLTKDFNLAFTQYLRVHDIESQHIAIRSKL